MVYNKNKKKNTSLASVLITLIIVALLILSGPAQAVSVNISGLQDSYTQGSSIDFQIKIGINDPDKFVPITNISLDVMGPITKNRIFALDGTPLSGDSIISITPVSIPRTTDFGYGSGYGYDARIGYSYDFGYGYGYGYQGVQLIYIYNVTIDTATLSIGDYNVIASLNTGNAGKPAFNSAASHFTITPTTPGPSAGIISGYKINDSNGNGIYDAGEQPIPGWQIRLFGGESFKVATIDDLGFFNMVTTTDAMGFYKFENLPDGTYYIMEEFKPGWIPTNITSMYVKLEKGKNSINNNFTNRQLRASCSFNDLQFNNMQWDCDFPNKFTEIP